jgi:uncharacterized protein YdeI (YjbR/CyaY-like superfamily)
VPDPIPELLVRDVGAWRAWLADSGGDSSGVWLVLAKGGARKPTSLTYDEALDEALCFGWIDGTLRKRDDVTYVRRFTPRRSGSSWSKRNVEIVARLRSEERMTEAGEAAIRRAELDGTFAAAYSGSATIEVPDDLAHALSAEPRARAAFDCLSSQNRYAVLRRIEIATSPADRKRRISTFVDMLANGRTPHPQ